MRKEDKRAVSPVITTVLLVLIVLTLAILIIVWGTQFIPEKLSKFGNPIEDGCSNVQFTASLQEGKLYLVNTGDVYIHKVGLKSKGAAKSTIDPNEVSMNPGDAESIDFDSTGVDELEIIPILLGETEGEKIQEFSCSESSWKTISL